MHAPLQIDAYLDTIRDVVETGACVVVAPTGAGKTTRVPPALLDRGPLMLLQPRRVAARALTRRIAAEQGGGGWRLESAPRAVRSQGDVFGESPSALPVMRSLKAAYDPAGILNPGRFVGGL